MGKKHYYIIKYIVCDLSGERCGEVAPYQTKLLPDCKICDYWRDAKMKEGV